MNTFGKTLLAAVSLVVILGLGWWAMDSTNQSSDLAQSDQIDSQWLSEMQAASRLLSDSVIAGGNIGAALAMLDALEARVIKHPAQEKLVGVRVAIAADRQRLQAARALDIQQAALQIESIILDIDSLPLISAFSSGRPAVGASEPSAAESGLPSWREILAGLQARLSDMVRIRRVENPEAVFLTPEQGALVTERLRLRLLSAKIALVSRQDKIFAQDIAQAEKILGDVFDPQSPKVASHRKTLSALNLLAEKIPLPSRLALTEALEVIRSTPEQ
jgi:uncharacterized protein HemX